MNGLRGGDSSVKLVQRGVVAAAGNVTIRRVKPGKTLVISVGKGSAGTVAATGSISGTISGMSYSGGSNGYATRIGGDNTANMTESATISGGTTNLIAAAYSARLINANTLYCDGPCEWQVVEYN